MNENALAHKMKDQLGRCAYTVRELCVHDAKGNLQLSLACVGCLRAKSHQTDRETVTIKFFGFENYIYLRTQVQFCVNM